ncbi:hypothetical protein V1291_000254 [Nitrobacteraceae bacterium AZCC 1564]
MTTFDEREQAFEQKFVIDQELLFKSTARCNRLLGMWAAEQLGLSGDAASSYAKDIVAADVAAPGTGEVLQKLSRDLTDKGISEEVIRQKMGEFLLIAIQQVKAGL